MSPLPRVLPIAQILLIEKVFLKKFGMGDGRGGPEGGLGRRI